MTESGWRDLAASWGVDNFELIRGGDCGELQFFGGFYYFYYISIGWRDFERLTRRAQAVHRLCTGILETRFRGALFEGLGGYWSAYVLTFVKRSARHLAPKSWP